MQSLEARINHLTRRWAGTAQHRFRLVILLEAAATALFAVYTLLHLGVNMDNKKLLSPDLPFQRAASEYRRYFPSLDDALLIVVDARTPEQARRSAVTLADAIAREADTFSDVYVPGGDDFFQRHGLLYRTPEELDELVDHVAVMQPVLADLSRDPSIASLARLIRAGLERERDDGGGARDWPAVLDRIGEATVRVFDEYPVSISWQDLLVQGTALQPQARQVIVAEPVLEFGRLLAAHDAIEEIRTSARELSLTPERGVRVRITGNPALNYEEMIGLAWDIGASSAFSLAAVVALLYLALRNTHLVAAAGITLVAGLIWTAAFATAAVGQLNVLSIAFAVLFIGLGVDFAIHLGMHYADALREGRAPHETMQISMQRIGSALLLCAVTTAIGFLAFFPTGYRGVAELGLISGGGMFITLFQTMTLFPALLIALTGRRAERTVPPLPLQLSPPRAVRTHPAAITVLALALGLAAASQVPRLRFDMNVVDMRDPSTESVQAFEDLLARSSTSPWYIDVLAPSLERADRLAGQMRDLDVVRSATTLTDYVPEQQELKREILETVTYMLEVPSAGESPTPSTDEQIEALRALHDELDAAWLQRADSPLARSARKLHGHLGELLERIEREGNTEEALSDLQSILLGNFSEQLDRLREAADPPPVTMERLPDQLRRRMLAPEGPARVQIFPREDLSDHREVTEFVDAVRSVEPRATGVAVNLVEFGRATSRSLRQALTSAFVAITVLLLVLWRRAGDTLLVLAPLALGAVLTGGLMVVLGMSFNFANVVVLPLLVGIGVDSGIHLVHAARGGGRSDALLESVTARAVLFSAVTTIASFGSLSLSSHRGIATMGVLLVCGILIILACNLVVLPALITLRARWRAR